MSTNHYINTRKYTLNAVYFVYTIECIKCVEALLINWSIFFPTHFTLIYPVILWPTKIIAVFHFCNICHKQLNIYSELWNGMQNYSEDRTVLWNETGFRSFLASPKIIHIYVYYVYTQSEKIHLCICYWKNK